MGIEPNHADPRRCVRDGQAVHSAADRRLRSFKFTRGRRGNPFHLANVSAAAVPPMRPGEEAEVRVELTPLRRGAVRFVEVVLARSEQGQGVLGVIDGNSPNGVEAEADVVWRHDLLRNFGYKR